MTERRADDHRAAPRDRDRAAAPNDEHAGGAGATGGARHAAAPRRPARSQRPAVLAYAGSAVGFMAVLGALSWQVAGGSDPAIGAGEQAAAPPAKRVLVRRIVRRVIVTREPRDAPASAAPAAAAPAAPAPAPASAPAPAPAPPTTRSS